MPTPLCSARMRCQAIWYTRAEIPLTKKAAPTAGRTPGIAPRLWRSGGFGQPEWPYSLAMADTRADGNDVRRRLPSVDEVLRQDWARALEDRHGRASLLRHLRALLDEVRESAARGDSAEVAEVVASLSGRLARRLERAAAPSLVPVINATGLGLHTNPGPAPPPPEAAAPVAQIASSYSNLGYGPGAGRRG